MSDIQNRPSKPSQPEEHLENIIDEKSNESEATSHWTLKAYIKSIVIMLAIGFLISNAYYINDNSQRAVETRFGQLIKITGPGFYLKLPFIESYQQYQVDKQKLAYKSVSTASSDNYTFYGKIVLEYSLCKVSTEKINDDNATDRAEIEPNKPKENVYLYLTEILQSILVSTETEQIYQCEGQPEYIHHNIPNKNFHHYLEDIKASTLKYLNKEENFYHYLGDLKTIILKYLGPKNQENFDNYLKGIVTSTFKKEMGKISMEKVPNDKQKRKTLEDYILKSIKKKAYELLKIEVHDFSIPYYGWSQQFLLNVQKTEDNKAAFDAAVWAKNRTQEIAEYEKQKSDQNIEDADNEAKLNKVEAETKAKLKKIKAQAEANAKLTAAEAEAYVIRKEGEAQAAAFKAQAQALTENPNLIESAKIKRWDGKLPSYFLNQEVSPFMSPISKGTLPIQSQ